jgi:hypothetical protein
MNKFNCHGTFDSQEAAPPFESFKAFVKSTTESPEPAVRPNSPVSSASPLNNIQAGKGRSTDGKEASNAFEGCQYSFKAFIFSKKRVLAFSHNLWFVLFLTIERQSNQAICASNVVLAAIEGVLTDTNKERWLLLLVR